jgi:hypothetical protein
MGDNFKVGEGTVAPTRGGERDGSSNAAGFENTTTADSVSVFTSTDGGTYTKQATSTTPDDRWFTLALSTSVRYVRLEATKTYGYFADYIFVDEIQIYGAR